MSYLRRVPSLLILLTAVASLVAVVMPVSDANAGSANLSLEVGFVDRINGQRAAVGLRPLVVDADMAAGAADWTSTMVAGSFLDHADSAHIRANIPAGHGKTGENVGRGRTVESLTTAFMQSQAHRANILDPAFTHIGVAAAAHPDDGRIYTTHRFAALAPSAASPPTPTPAQSVMPAPTSAPAPAPRPARPVTPAWVEPLAPVGVTPDPAVGFQRGSRRLGIEDAPPPPRGSRRGAAG